MDEVFVTYKIEDRSYVSLAKREIQRRLKAFEFSTQKNAEVDIIVSELCSNLVKHTDDGGELVFRVNNEDKNNPHLELFCIDKGPGTNDIQKMVKDGVSSSNTLGQGLGAISRLSDFFQIYSMKGWGTVIYIKKFREPSVNVNQKRKENILINVLQQPIPGETICGDGYSLKRLPRQTRIFVGDGLGHGRHAHEAVQEAIVAFQQNNDGDAVSVIRAIHEKVKRTRGLVATVAIIDHEEKKWRIAGVGNIATRLYDGLESKAVMSYNGIIGLNLPTSMQDNIISAEKFQFIIMSSDGLKTKWELSKYTSILKYSPAIIAACLFKDHARKTDDMTVLTGKLNF